MNTKQILLVDDDESLRRVMQIQLEEAGYTVEAVPEAESALTALGTESYPLVITDLIMPGMSGMELLHRIRQENPDAVVIMMTAFGTIQGAVEAMRSGAFDYITKPINYEELVILVQRALAHRSLVEEVRTLRASIDQKYGFESIIGCSKSLLYVLDLAGRAARVDSTVLIQGETGTGKELLARAIHYNSERAKAPFITINCGAIPRDLLESELFGHVKGSFTGAVAHKIGKVEAANGGTLFLDEIAEMPLELQVKLLRLVQEREVEKVGSPTTMKVDVRIIAATHRNLQAMIEDGAFREDLYYRLSVIPLELPPLRQRADDIPELVSHFFVKAKNRVGRPEVNLPVSLLPYFQRYTWPGNIRELENVIERIVVLSAGNEITLHDLPDYLRKPKSPAETYNLELQPEGISLEAVERDLIQRAMEKFNWNQTQAARYLDISRKTLIYRLEKYGIRKEP
jgi:DNA-binding NtrC family response regulator